MPAVRNSTLSTQDSALILFAHGTRDAQWSAPFEAIRQAVAKRRPDLAVKLAFLELTEPSLPDCVEQLVGAGHTRITVAPLFLARGGHLKQDLPRLVKRLSTRHPMAEITVLPPIGEVTELLDAIAEWLVEGVRR
ncbi:MAG: cobalamin biosynthesis protein CbiX [Betaproteobacteria bacterium]|nr:cobalamin biosynthesis protein CbiX [Betaproteobacteria bacterium]